MKLTQEQKAEIRERHAAQGEDAPSSRELAEKHGVSQTTMAKILRGGPKGKRKARAAKTPDPTAVTVVPPGFSLKGVLVAHLEYLRKETAKVESVIEALED